MKKFYNLKELRKHDNRNQCGFDSKTEKKTYKTSEIHIKSGIQLIIKN